MTAAPVRMQAVSTMWQKRRFVALPFRLFADDPAWVPPLRADVYDRISARHPAAAHEESALWMAWRGGRPVGRIGACVNRRFDEFQGLRWAWVGFFESVDDQEVASALFDRALGWAADHGASDCVGPASFTTNDECGLQVDGFSEPPTVLTAGNPRYYERLWTRAGWRPERDLLAWRLDPDTAALSPRQSAALTRVLQRSGLRVRGMRRAAFDAEVERFFEVYNAAWARNWGFVPATQAEIRHVAQALKYVIDPDLAVIAETPGGLPVGVALVLPDFNLAMRKVRSGRLLPSGWWRLLRAHRSAGGARVYALGVRREYEGSGVGLLLYRELFERMRARPHIRAVEASWILDTNRGMNDALAAMGGRECRRWRMYRHDPVSGQGGP